MRQAEYASSIFTHIESASRSVRRRASRRITGLCGDRTAAQVSQSFQTRATHIVFAKPGIGPSSLVAFFPATYLGAIPKTRCGERQDAIERSSSVRRATAGRTVADARHRA